MVLTTQPDQPVKEYMLPAIAGHLPPPKTSLDPFLTLNSTQPLLLVFPGATCKPHSSLTGLENMRDLAFPKKDLESRVCNVHCYYYLHCLSL